MFTETTAIRNAAARLQEAFTSGDKEQAKAAFEEFGEAIVASVQADYESAHGNKDILLQRGFRVLTPEEEKYYQKVIEAGKSSKTVQAMNGMLDVMEVPATIIEDIYKELRNDHPLLAKINFVSVAYLTKWILNDATIDAAVWGEVGSEITKKIEGAFKVVDLTQNKLSAYAMIEKDMLDLGPSFLDAYIRAFLKEAVYIALEKGIVCGSGHNCPIGMDRDIHAGVSVSTTEGYPQKKAVKLSSFAPADYGPVLAKLAETEKGNPRKFDEVTLICSQVDYLSKVMPATTVLGMNGLYAHDVFPFPTEVIRTTALETGKAILVLPEEYFFGLGTSKDGVIEYSDDVKFLEDMRVFKIKMHGAGRAADNTVALLLDISGMVPAYVTVRAADAGSETGTIGSLTVTSAAGTATGDTKLTVSPEKADATNVYKYKVAAEADSVAYGDNVRNWSTWDGTSDITAATGKVITLVEAGSDYKARKVGTATVTAKA